MKYPLIQCDICGLESYSNDDFTEIKQGVAIIGSPKYEDICKSCTMWFIKEFDKKRLKNK